MSSKNASVQQIIEQIYREDFRYLYATLIRLLGDMDLAEEALHEAFHIAVTRWQQEGVPENPKAWLVSTARFKAIDQIRKRTRQQTLVEDIQIITENVDVETFEWKGEIIEDDQLRLIFTCCHPAIDPQIQVPLTLREVCGLTTEQIASAFLVSPATMAQRIVRGKAKIREARIPFEIPERSELSQRLDAVLSVIYLVFNEGYSASSGDSVTRTELSNEAIRLARMVFSLLPDAEVAGLLALMLLHESRRRARTDDMGDIILLEAQDRSLWDQQLINEGIHLVEGSLASQQFGFYTLQAAILAVHAQAQTAALTDWNQIDALYLKLLEIEPSPIIELNRAVAVAMRDGPQAGLQLVEAILQRDELTDYHLCHATRGELLSRSGDNQRAINAFETALKLARQAPERRNLQKKIDALKAQ